ncbi:MAG TPA: succinylglutamate desuccinylase/aspartoacylase family protein [Kiloniellales bacterium]|nr:succinylglutamate desuccinylase/aspartoacylase family protein [Kiloniellales bacterium]
MSDWQRIAAEAFDPFAGQRQQVLVEIAWEDGRLELPVVSLGDDAGPTVLVTGGTHGDEYEGQWTAAALCRVLSAEDVHGRLIVVPTLNRPAALAGQRTSPLDGADINRVFPPREGAKGPSAAIARFLWRKCILPATALLDIHSGGNEMEFVLSSNLQGRLGSTASEADVAALMAMDAPYAIVFDEGELGEGMQHSGTIEGAARALGKRCFSSELGGAGRLTPDSVAVARAAATHLLRHLGLLRGPVPPSRSVLLTMARPENTVVAPVGGLFAPHVRLGDEVRQGQRLGEVCRLEDSGFPLTPVAARCDGVVVAVAAHARVSEGSTLFFVAERP